MGCARTPSTTPPFSLKREARNMNTQGWGKSTIAFGVLAAWFIACAGEDIPPVDNTLRSDLDENYGGAEGVGSAGAAGAGGDEQNGGAAGSGPSGGSGG